MKASVSVPIYTIVWRGWTLLPVQGNSAHGVGYYTGVSKQHRRTAICTACCARA
jgi:hypothetical protein